MSPTRCGNAPGTCDRTLLESGWLLRLRGFDHQHQVFLRIRPRPRFDDAEGPVSTQRDGVAGVPAGYSRSERRRVCGARPLRSTRRPA
jgi:hypothetical protein